MAAGSFFVSGFWTVRHLQKELRVRPPNTGAGVATGRLAGTMVGWHGGFEKTILYYIKKFL